MVCLRSVPYRLVRREGPASTAGERNFCRSTLAISNVWVRERQEGSRWARGRRRRRSGEGSTRRRRHWGGVWMSVARRMRSISGRRSPGGGGGRVRARLSSGMHGTGQSVSAIWRLMSRPCGTGRPEGMATPYSKGNTEAWPVVGEWWLQGLSRFRTISMGRQERSPTRPRKIRAARCHSEPPKSDVNPGRVAGARSGPSPTEAGGWPCGRKGRRSLRPWQRVQPRARGALQGRCRHSRGARRRPVCR